MGMSHKLFILAYKPYGTCSPARIHLVCLFPPRNPCSKPTALSLVLEDSVSFFFIELLCMPGFLFVECSSSHHFVSDFVYSSVVWVSLLEHFLLSPFPQVFCTLTAPCISHCVFWAFLTLVDWGTQWVCHHLFPSCLGSLEPQSLLEWAFCRELRVSSQCHICWIRMSEMRPRLIYLPSPVKFIIFLVLDSAW
jgi:hypothetical protein